MKRLFLLLVMASALPLAAQVTEQEPRSAEEARPHDLKLMVRNPKGRVMRGLELAAQIKGSQQQAQTLDRFGNRFFKVVDTDTLIVTMAGNVYEFPVAGFDSLYVVFRNKSKIEGIAVRDRIIDTGYGTYRERDRISAADAVDMTGSDVVHYRDLRDFIDGRVSGVQFWGDNLVVRGLSTEGALIVVDGMPKRSFADANASVVPMEIASITVLKDASAAVYGVKAGNGVVVITTKRGAKQ